MKQFILAAACATGFLSLNAVTGPVLTDGAVVRIQSASIETGWHTGRMHLDPRKCWMVKLDKATQEDYTMLALLVVDQLEIANGRIWKPVGVKPVLNASPADCREYGSD